MRASPRTLLLTNSTPRSPLPRHLAHLSRPPHFPHLLPPRRHSSTTTTPLLTTHDIPAPHIGIIRILTLSSPSNRNAISRALLSQLSSEINDLSTAGDGSRGGVRALIIASALENVFCAGADLKERKGMSDEETASFLRRLRDTFTTLEELPIPTISAVASTALGGGFELALATTFRVCAGTCTLGLPETRLGIIPGAGGTYRLRRLIGSARAMELVLSGRRIRGYEAKQMGICERVVGNEDTGEIMREEVLSAAMGFAREICTGGPVAVGAAMRAVRGGGGLGGKGRERERDEEGEAEEYGACLERGRGDRDEALRVFGEKRGVRFRGEGGWNGEKVHVGDDLERKQ